MQHWLNQRVDVSSWKKKKKKREILNYFLLHGILKMVCGYKNITEDIKAFLRDGKSWRIREITYQAVSLQSYAE